MFRRISRPLKAPNLYIYTGGAVGADYAWASLALKLDVPCFVFTFEGHQLVLPEKFPTTRVVSLTEEELKAQETLLERVALKLKKTIPKDSYKRNLLLRSCCMVSRALLNDSDACCFASFKNPIQETVEKKLFKEYAKNGGTGWTTTAFQLESGKHALDTDTAPTIPKSKGSIIGIGTRYMTRPQLHNILELGKRMLQKEDER